MTLVNRIDSHTSALAIAKEQTIGVLPVSPNWIRHKPSSYSDFGGEVTKAAPNPISNNRQRKKGETTGLSVSAGFQEELSFYNQLDLMESLFFASKRTIGSLKSVTAVDIDSGNPDEYEVASTSGVVVGSLIKGFNFTNIENNSLNVVTAIVANTSVEVATGSLVAEASPPSSAYIKVVGYQASVGDIDVSASGNFAKFTSTTFDFTTLGLVPGQWIFVGGDSAGHKFSNIENNGFKRVRSVSANEILIDKSFQSMVTEANTTSTIRIFYGDVLKNEKDNLIVSTSFSQERILGAPVIGSSNLQSEIVSGTVVSEATINIPTEDLVKVDWSFLGIDHSVRKAVSESGPGPLQTSVQNPIETGIYNTSQDFARINLSLVSSSQEAPSTLLGFHDELTLTFNNNLTVNKAIGRIGGFDITPGNFLVSGSLRSYLSSVAAVSAVRDNSDVTLDAIMVKENRAIVIDLPLITLGDGRATVELDQSIMLPLNMDAATAVSINENLDYTAMLTLFHYVPDSAI